MKFINENTTNEVIEIRIQFKDFKVVDYDDNYIVLEKEGLGMVEGRILRGSLGSYDYKFVVEKFGERSKLFWGKNVIKRIKKYLGLRVEKTAIPKSNAKKRKKPAPTKAKPKKKGKRKKRKSQDTFSLVAQKTLLREEL